MMKINISAPINNTGYGISSINIIKALHKNNIDISLFPIGGSHVDNQDDYELFVPLAQKSIVNFDINSPFLKIWHQFDLAQHIGRGKYFAFPFFELDTFNELEKKHLSIPECIIVTSDWAKQVVLDNLQTNVEICPLGVDTNIFDYHKYETNKNIDDKYIFLNIGKWEIRKGHDILLNLFNTAFPNDENVELWILASETTNGYSSQEELKQWKKMYESPRIKLFSGVSSHQDIAELISMCDCGLYPSRAEGWNLELLETMAMNKPAIATYYSAHTEFCNENNCYLIDIDSKELAQDGKAFKGQGYWAKFGQKQFDQTVEYMRYVYKNKIRTNKFGLETAQKFSWNNTANSIFRCINNYQI